MLDEVRDGGGIVAGRGERAGFRWEVRAAVDDEAQLHIWVQFLGEDGAHVGGGGCGYVGLANEHRPVVISWSRCAPDGSFFCLGQLVREGTRVELQRSDESVLDADLLSADDLPVQLWLAFTNELTLPTEIRGFANDRLLDVEQIAVKDSWRNGASAWGPFEHEDATNS